MRRESLVAGLISLVLALPGVVSATDGLARVGEEVHLVFANPLIPGLAHKPAASRLVWSQEIFYPEATYIAPHFESFDLPPSASLVVREPNGSATWTYRGLGIDKLGRHGGFWGISITGDTVVLELWANSRVEKEAIKIDRFAHGIVDLDHSFAFDSSMRNISAKNICGADEMLRAKCYESTEPTIYRKSQAVVLVLVNGLDACTGFLVGSAGDLLTNNHCIPNSSTAANSTYKLMYEGDSCTSPECFGGCSSPFVATNGTLVKTSSLWDYSLIHLPTNPNNQPEGRPYGFLKLSTVPATVNQRIYIPNHRSGFTKQISLRSTHPTDESGFCEVYTTNSAASCLGHTGNVGYFCDTYAGVSGAPVIAYSNNLVVALHSCGGCNPSSGNLGQPIGGIINHLGASLPPNSTASTCAGYNQACTYDADCCSNLCFSKSLPMRCL